MWAAGCGAGANWEMNMVKTLLVVLGLSATALLLNGPVYAAPKNKAVCSTKWWSDCNKRCSSRGGVVRLCPEYCRRRQRDQGCNV